MLVREGQVQIKTTRPTNEFIEKYPNRIEYIQNNTKIQNNKLTLKILFNYDFKVYNPDIVMEITYDKIITFLKTKKYIIDNTTCKYHAMITYTSCHILNHLFEMYGETFFVPLQKPSWNINKNNTIIEICIYHNNKVYEIMKLTDDDSMINMPIIGRERYAELCSFDHNVVSLF